MHASQPSWLGQSRKLPVFCDECTSEAGSSQSDYYGAVHGLWLILVRTNGAFVWLVVEEDFMGEYKGFLKHCIFCSHRYFFINCLRFYDAN